MHRIFLALFISFNAAAASAGPLEELSGYAGDAAVTVAPVPAAPMAVRDQRGSGADMREFFRKLESIGLDTVELRAVTGMVSVRLQNPLAPGAAAQYGYILNRLYMPPEDFKEEGHNRVRFDLPSYLINTLIHEYVHASSDVRASEDAARGTPAREQYEATAAIRADLRSQALFYRYSWMKADEVAAYFFGDAMGGVFSKVEDIVVYNTRLGGSKVSTVAEAQELGGRFILPAEGGGFAGLGKNTVFGRNSVYDQAMFNGSVVTGFEYIHWQERQFVKDDLYRNLLGLRPPADTAELLLRLNTIDNAWIRSVREEVAKARMKNALMASGQG